MNTIKQIGKLDHDSGYDEYVLVTNNEDILTPEQAEDFILPLVYTDSNQAGGYYCRTVRAVQAKYSDNKCIVTIEHRYDI